MTNSSDCGMNISAIPIFTIKSPRRTSAMAEFDPAAHRMVPQQRWFEDFVLGERFVIPSRTMTSAVFAAFQTANGDTHPGLPGLDRHGLHARSQTCCGLTPAPPWPGPRAIAAP